MSKVVYEKRDRIGYVTLNRPEALNALDDELNDALRLETVNGYSSVGDFREVAERLRKF
jgi:enoyl-CoA hydratase/carnithine racemase